MTPPAGWYPDNADPRLLRYYDGTRWTAHTAPNPQMPTPPKKRKRLRIALSALVAAALVAIGAAIVVPKVLGGSDIPSVSKDLITNVSAKYDYTKQMLDLPRDYDFKIDVNFNTLTTDFKLDDVYEVYVDPGLTVKSDATVGAYDDHTVHILPDGEGGTLDHKVPPPKSADDDGDYWFNDEYFLVRRVDDDGKMLKKPVVTRFTIHSDLETPVPQVKPTGTHGDVSISWQRVPGATEYFVVSTDYRNMREGGGFGVSRIIARTSTTSWTSTTTAKGRKPYVETQNARLAMFDGQSAEDLRQFGGTQWTTDDDFRFSVIASNGKTSSTAHSLDALDAIGAMPYETALSRDEGGLKTLDSTIADLSKRFYYTDLVGNTRAVTAQLSTRGVTTGSVYYGANPATATRVEAWNIPVTGMGTRLGAEVTIAKSKVTDLNREIAAFNRAAVAAAPATGGSKMVISINDEKKKAEDASSTPPKTSYPVFGSTPFTRYLAQQLIGHTEVIDVSDYLDAPGAPDVLDALDEAEFQNPYAGLVATASYSPEGKTLSITYVPTPGQLRDEQKALASGVQKTIRSIIAGRMTPAEKVTAINNWLVAHVEYDHPALQALEQDADKARYEYDYALTAAGVFDKGKVVCQGYAEAFKALAHAAGLDAVVITGHVLDGGDHAWDEVKVNGAWKAVDVTWNDPGPNRYLMIPDSGFTGPAARRKDTDWMVDQFLTSYATG